MTNTSLGTDCCGDRYEVNTTHACKCGCKLCYCRSCYEDHCVELVEKRFKRTKRVATKPKKVKSS